MSISILPSSWIGYYLIFYLFCTTNFLDVPEHSLTCEQKTIHDVPFIHKHSRHSVQAVLPLHILTQSLTKHTKMDLRVERGINLPVKYFKESVSRLISGNKSIKISTLP